MIEKITRELQKHLNKTGTKAILNGIPTLPYSFESLQNNSSTITFVDGGEATLLESNDFILQFIRVYAGSWQGTKFLKGTKKECYALITRTKTTVFEENIPELECTFEEMPGKIRRYLELLLAQEHRGCVVIDGNLDEEEKNCKELIKGLHAVSKTNEVISDAGTSVSADLMKLATQPSWKCLITKTPNLIHIAKLHPKSKYTFKIEGPTDIINNLVCQSVDPSFLGYPYGLLHADKNARVSKQEKRYLYMRIIAKLEPQLTKHLNTKNAHDILDSI